MALVCRKAQLAVGFAFGTRPSFPIGQRNPTIQLGPFSASLSGFAGGRVCRPGVRPHLSFRLAVSSSIGSSLNVSSDIEDASHATCKLDTRLIQEHSRNSCHQATHIPQPRTSLTMALSDWTPSSTSKSSVTQANDIPAPRPDSAVNAPPPDQHRRVIDFVKVGTIGV